MLAHRPLKPSPSPRRRAAAWRLRGWSLLLLFGALLALFAHLQPGHAQSARLAVVLEVKGAIGPATGDYVSRGLREARERNAEIVVLRMDTPGGLDSAMRDIIKGILGSPVPVASYVSPSGARAASAGTYILYASHVAAMAPATNLGSATPVQIGGMPGAPDEQPARPSPTPKDKDEAKEGENDAKPLKGTAMERKITEDAVAYIRGLALHYGRNAEWAEKAVREAANLTAEDALAINVIDLMADSVSDLLKQVHGRAVKLETGERTLDTEGLTVEVIAPDWRNRLLSVITDPNIAYILMLVGIYGIIFELSNPGYIFPGVTGAICLVLALYAFQVLPINYAGLALILLGIVFMIAEAFIPSFGVLGFGGIAAFVVGSIILLDETNLSVSLPLVGGTALVSAGFFIWVLGRVVKLRRRKVVTGAEEMQGLIGEAMEDFETEGRVWVHSEAWNAHTSRPLRKGDKLRVLRMDGLRLEVEPVSESPITHV